MASVVILKLEAFEDFTPPLSPLYARAWTEPIRFGIFDTHGLFCIFVRVHAPWGSALFVDSAYQSAYTYFLYWLSFTSTPPVLLWCTYARYLCIDSHGDNLSIQDSFL